MKELESITRSSFSTVDFKSTNHILPAVGFCFYYWNAVWICLSVKASTRSFGRRDKRIEISKVRPETSTFVSFHKIGFHNIQVNVLTDSCQEFLKLGLKKLHFLLFYIHSQPIRPRFPTVVATPTLLNCCTWVAAKAKRLERRGTRPKWNGCTPHFQSTYWTS